MRKLLLKVNFRAICRSRPTKKTLLLFTKSTLKSTLFQKVLWVGFWGQNPFFKKSFWYFSPFVFKQNHFFRNLFLTILYKQLLYIAANAFALIVKTSKGIVVSITVHCWYNGYQHGSWGWYWVRHSNFYLSQIL